VNQADKVKVKADKAKVKQVAVVVVKNNIYSSITSFTGKKKAWLVPNHYAALLHKQSLTYDLLANFSSNTFGRTSLSLSYPLRKTEENCRFSSVFLYKKSISYTVIPAFWSTFLASSI
jgi:hypothetical protein